MKKSWLLKINPKTFRKWIIPILVVLAVVLWSAVAVSPGSTLDVHFVDVGQGDAIYGRLPSGEDFLIDGGPDNKVLSELGEVMPFWDREINLVVASHNHADHIRGLIDVLEKYQVKEIWLTGATHNTKTYEKFRQTIDNEKDALVKKVKAGDERELGMAKIRVLFPIESKDSLAPDDQHDATIVTRLSYGEVDYLFTGDLNEGHEQEILNSSFGILNSEIFKVPHHGSATGLLEEFLDAVKPKYAVIQVGANNQFGHPAPSIIRKLDDRLIPYFRTDQNGRVEISTDGKNIFVKTKR